MRIFVWTLLALTVAALAGVALVWALDDPPGLPLEIAKACLTLLSAVVMVQLITFIVAEAANGRKVRAEQDEFRRATLTRLNNSFIGIKALRRETRAGLEGSGPGTTDARLSRAAYHGLMKQVNAVQLELELLAKDIETSHGVFLDAQAIYLNVSRMEEYLNGLVDEWEEKGRGVTAGGVALAAVPQLNDLLGEYEGSRFRPGLVHNYYQAVEQVRRSMTAGQSLRWKVVLAPLLAPSAPPPPPLPPPPGNGRTQPG